MLLRMLMGLLLTVLLLAWEEGRSTDGTHAEAATDTAAGMLQRLLHRLLLRVLLECITDSGLDTLC